MTTSSPKLDWLRRHLESKIIEISNEVISGKRFASDNFEYAQLLLAEVNNVEPSRLKQ